MQPISFVGMASALLAAWSLNTPVAAHVTLEAGETVANSTHKAVLRVPHGCDGDATHTITVEIPKGFIDVRPMPKAGWTTTVSSGPYEEPYQYHGRTLSEGVQQISWAGGPLPDEFYDEFVFRGYVADLPAGTRLHFKVTQGCESGEIGWTEVAAPGADPHGLEHPAPILLVAAGEDSSGHSHHSSHAGTQQAGSASVGPITVEGAYARPSLGKAPNSAVYMTIRTTGESDRLLKADSPIAEAVEVHTTEMDSRGVMKMRPVDAVSIEPTAATELQPGGLHIMLLRLVGSLEKGGTIPLTLTFEKAGELTLDVPVGEADASNQGHHHRH